MIIHYTKGKPDVVRHLLMRTEEGLGMMTPRYIALCGHSGITKRDFIDRTRSNAPVTCGACYSKLHQGKEKHETSRLV